MNLLTDHVMNLILADLEQYFAIQFLDLQFENPHVSLHQSYLSRLKSLVLFLRIRIRIKAIMQQIFKVFQDPI